MEGYADQFRKAEEVPPPQKKIVGWKLVEADQKYYKKETVYLGNWQPIYSEPIPPVCELPDEKLYPKDLVDALMRELQNWKFSYDSDLNEAIEKLNNYKANQ